MDIRNENFTPKLMQRLAVLVPDYFQPDFKATRSQALNLFAVISYVVPMDRGRLEVEIEITNNVGAVIADDHQFYPTTEDARQLIKELHGTAGILFKRANYHHGISSEQDLYLGRSSPNAYYIARNEKTEAFRAILNLLCKQQELSDDALLCPERYSRSGPMDYIDGCSDTTAAVARLSLAELQAATEPINQFFNWLQKNQKPINTAGEYARLFIQQCFAVKAYKEQGKQGRILTDIIRDVSTVRDSYFTKLQEIMTHLTPLVNNRMDYLR